MPAVSENSKPTSKQTAAQNKQTEGNAPSDNF